MSPTLPSHATRRGFFVCPGTENASLPSDNKSTLPRAHGYATVGRALGRRSLDAFSSIRGSLKSRRTLNTTTNQLAYKSASSSPIEPAKQKWYDSLRVKSSKTPTPSRSTSISLTRKQSRFFRSTPDQSPVPDSPSCVRQPLRAPLSKLEIATFQPELQTSSMFDKLTEKLVAEADLDPKSRKNTHEEAACLRSQFISTPESKSPGTALLEMDAALALSLGSIWSNTLPSSIQTPNVASTIINAHVPAPREPLEPWRVLCDLYYKGTPWQAEHKKGFPDATHALAHFALCHMLSDNRDCSQTLLWTCESGEIGGERPYTNQAFTVYPLIDGPQRTELAKESSHLDWAIITFTNGPTTTKSTELEREDERLKTAVRHVISMGYHVDIWTACDDGAWREAIEVAESQYRRLVQEGRKIADQVNVFSFSHDYELRQRYQAFVRHALAGFSQDELTDLHAMQNAINQAKRKSQNYTQANLSVRAVQEHDIKPAVMTQRPRSAFRTGAAPELMGFLEHVEESITEVE